MTMAGAGPGTPAIAELPRCVSYAFLDEPPFGAPGPGGRASGYDVELAETVLRAIGVERFEPVLTTFSELIPGVASGRWLMNTGMFVMPERARDVLFSRPIWALLDGLLVKAGNPKGLRSYAAAARDPSVRLGGVRGNVQIESALKAGVPAQRMTLFASQHDIIPEIEAGRIDAYPGAALAHRGFLGGLPGHGLEVVELQDETGPAPLGAFSFARTSEALCLAVDHQLRGFLGSQDHLDLARRHGLTANEITPVLAEPRHQETA